MSRHTEKFQRSEFRHNPYIGTFQRTEGSKPDINRHNPYIGYVNRHAPLDGSGIMSIADQKPFRRNFISNITISQQRRPVNMLALKNLPLSLYSSSKHSSTSNSEDSPGCAICLEIFKDGDELRILNCSHCFHRACVDIWLLGTLSDDIQLNGTCPTCRQHAAGSSPVRPQPRLQVATNFARCDQSWNMSDLSVRSSSVTESASQSTLSFDLVSPMSPDWSQDEIFHHEEEYNCLNIDNPLVDGNSRIDCPLDVDTDSMESLEYSIQSLCADIPLCHTSSSGLDNIVEDELRAVQSTKIIAHDGLNPPVHPSILDEDCDVVSVFSISQYSDCGFPLASPQASTGKAKIEA